MRHASVVLALGLAGALGTPASAYTIAAEHYATYAEVQSHIIGGLDFFARGDTEKLRIISVSPPGQGQTPYNLWNNDIPHAFKVVYNASGIAGISIDDLYSITLPVTIDAATNGLLVTAFTDPVGRTVHLDHLQITLPSFQIYNVDAVAHASPTDYLLVRTDLPLTDGFILSGQVTFAWSGSLPPPAEQWFEVSPVVTPEPAGAVLTLIGALLIGLPRRR